MKKKLENTTIINIPKLKDSQTNSHKKSRNLEETTIIELPKIKEQLKRNNTSKNNIVKRKKNLEETTVIDLPKIKGALKKEEENIKKAPQKIIKNSSSEKIPFKYPKKVIEQIVLENELEFEEEPIEKKVLPKIPKKNRVLFIIILLVSLSGIIISSINLFNWYQDKKYVTKELNNIIKDTVIEEVREETTEIEVTPPPKKTTSKSDYWEFVKMPLISVDFTSLLTKNPDTVAFIQVKGTNINYPVVQTTNNDYYLTHSFDKSKNGAGWVFLDYRNDINNLQDNTIIYAHARTDRTMFGSLKYALKDDWFQNKDNYIINISTPKENTLWQIFSTYTIPTETYYLISEFGSDESNQKFIETIMKRSVHNFNTEVTIDDKILTLSTCYNNDKKMVVHAKLLKKQIR